MVVAQHLLELGHTRMAYLSSGESFNEPEQARWHGFQEVLADTGIPLDACVRVEVGSTCEAGGLLGAERILQLSPCPTAVFAAGDRLAVGLIHALRQLGVQVPGDVAVVGYDDNPGSDYLEVPLTTVSYPKYEMGSLAAQMIFDRIEGRGVKRIEHVRLEPELVVRQSCGRPHPE